MSSRRILTRAPAAMILLLCTALACCQKTAPQPVTLGYFRLGWAQPDELPTAEPLSQQFIRETGIHLRNLPVPETTLDQLSVSRKLLESGSGLDVLGIDFIWSGVLADDLLDLRADLARELPLLEPKLLAGYVVDGRLVAVPNAVQIGVLEYRSDLLREYGYDHPPRAWNELEHMAEKIQKGQRAKGNKDFWGYVWQGADSEALTCNAIEWQVTEGGGRIAEDNKTISVNNPAAIRSWQRAKHWIGWISPPSVLAYRELDSTNAFDSGNAAFNRVWGGSTINRGGQTHFVHSRDALVSGRTGYSSIPSGAVASAGSLGGSGLAVAKNSRHPKEAIELVRFLIRAQARVDADLEKAAASQAIPPLGFDNVRTPERPDRGESLGEHSGHIVSRPSSILGAKYEPVARAFMHTVHAVLAGEKNAPQAAAELEKQLVQITGFTVGPPKKTD